MKYSWRSWRTVKVARWTTTGLRNAKTLEERSRIGPRHRMTCIFVHIRVPKFGSVTRALGFILWYTNAGNNNNNTHVCIFRIRYIALKAWRSWTVPTPSVYLRAFNTFLSDIQGSKFVILAIFVGCAPSSPPYFSHLTHIFFLLWNVERKRYDHFVLSETKAIAFLLFENIMKLERDNFVRIKIWCHVFMQMHFTWQRTSHFD